MQGVQVRNPHEVYIGELPTPQPKPDEVLIRVRSVGICGTDVEIVDGTMPYFTMGMAHYPIIPGHEWAGEVIALGANVTGFGVGDHVVGECSVGCARCPVCLEGNYHQCPNRRETGILNLNGGFAEYIAFPALYLHKVAPDLPFATACLVEPSAIAFNGVRQTEVSPRDYVVIFGDGPIGLLCLQVARAFGAAKVVMVGGTANRLARAAQLGADAVIHVETDDVLAVLREVGGGKLPDAAIEATGNPKAAEQAIFAVRTGGRVTLMGLFSGQHATIAIDHLVVNNITLRGRLGSPHIWGDVIRLIEGKRIDPEAIISHRIGLREFANGIEMLRNRSDGVIKIVVEQ